jgi:PTS system nitrogen regulatory IIA component
MVPVIETASDGGSETALPPTLGDYMGADRVAVRMPVSSRKRLFEQLAELVSSEETGPPLDIVLQTLVERERLGCTGVGKGIALPHGRIEDLSAPVIAIATLEQPVDYEAPDGQPVWFAACLIVPTDATGIHLRILATLASCLGDEGFRDEAKAAASAQELYSRFRDIRVSD